MASGVPTDALDGVTMGWWWYHDLSGLKDPATENAVNEFAKKYLKEYGDIPDTFAMYTYIATMETLRGVQASNSTGPGQSLQSDHGQAGVRGTEGPGEVAHGWPAGLQIRLFHHGWKRLQSPEG